MTQWEFDQKYLIQIELAFPRLKEEGYRPTSPPDTCYNCIAWAVGDQDRWWSPFQEDESLPGDGYAHEHHWPAGESGGNTVSVWKEAMVTNGFEACPSPDLESGFQKIAIYVDDEGQPQHMARQLPNGWWASKLGDACDLEHCTLSALEGKHYGHAKYFMKRSVAT